MSDKTNEFGDAYEQVQEIMFQIVSLLNSFGITDVNAGALMKLLGTTDEEAEPFLNKVMFINGDYLDLRDADVIPGEEDFDPPDSGTTLH